MCWEQLMEIYPDAKVIHTERVSKEKWWESATGSILVGHTLFPIRIINKIIPFWRNHHRMADDMWSFVLKKNVRDNEPGWPYIYKEEFLAAYSTNNERVREMVPGERLLIQDHGQGWNSLAEFLDKDIPDKPYPHRNTRADFIAFFRNLSLGVGVASCLLLCAVAFVLLKIVRVLGGSKKSKTQ
jgi:hypothetical protein